MREKNADYPVCCFGFVVKFNVLFYIFCSKFAEILALPSCVSALDVSIQSQIINLLVELKEKGCILIFSTHYPELLDEYDRNDSIFITRNRNGITAENLSKILKRNDIKKSDAYQSGFLEGTTPTYEAYMQLKKSIALTLM